jgi:hypothetical protein
MKTTLKAALILSTSCWLRLVNQPALADQLWVQRYDGPGHGNDFANAVAVDSAGNAIVTGQSQNGNGDYDFYTAKYASGDGTLLWERRYDSLYHLDDVATAVAVDSAGNVAVTGYSADAGPAGSLDLSTEFYTAKYSATDGHVIWARRGPGSAGYGYNPIKVAVDSAGNVVITGHGAGSIGGGYYTAKYAASDGQLLWEQHHANDPGDWSAGVVIDNSDNVIVTGTSIVGPYPGRLTVYTVKYAAVDGRLLWERYDTPSGRNAADGLAVDPEGNIVVVAGAYDPSAPAPELTFFYYTAKCAEADGHLLWTQQYLTPSGGPALVAVDSSGNVAVSAASPNNQGNPNSFSFATKYAGTDGQQIWLAPYRSCNPGGDYPHAVAVSQAGDVIVTGIGYDGDTVGYGHYHTVGYAAGSGDVLWEQNFVGPGNLNHGRDTAMAEAIDESRNVIVTGGLRMRTATTIM